MQITSKIENTAKDLRNRNKEEFANIKHQINDLENKSKPSKTISQRAQQLWLIKGDRNTRSIHDNLILAKEVLHYINGCKKNKKAWATLKVDLHKAYYNISWTFLEEDLFEEDQKVVEAVKQDLLFEDIEQAQNLNLIQGPKIGRQVNPLNHLFYADDLLLFLQANEMSYIRVDWLLNIFGQASGLFMNKDKSEMKFSLNTEVNNKLQMLNKINCSAVDYLGMYLGGYIDVPNPDRQNAALIIFYLQQKLAGWKSLMLSQAARFILIQLVLASIPIYLMHFTALTDKESRTCDSLINNFFWGDWGENKTPHLISWNKICRQKEMGGLGLRNTKLVNQAILGRFWNFDKLRTLYNRERYRQMLHNGLPIKHNLIRRGYNIDADCPFGCDSAETEQHLFKDCQFAKAIWFGSNIMIRTEHITQPSIVDWIDNCFNQANQSNDPLLKKLPFFLSFKIEGI
ncbi:ribonuclease H [Senna tora]|uniref:Ribonuclease H n=1 Tax=Senna tora TaxID=362788 RepID=A0A834X9Q5_9FABA|nr:ribonuclease H [Senna tora]